MRSFLKKSFYIYKVRLYKKLRQLVFPRVEGGLHIPRGKRDAMLIAPLEVRGCCLLPFLFLCAPRFPAPWLGVSGFEVADGLCGVASLQCLPYWDVGGWDSIGYVTSKSNDSC